MPSPNRASRCCRACCAAIAVNIEIMRTFVILRSMLAADADLAKKLATLEARYDDQFRTVFDAIRELMTPPAATKKRIGFLSH